MRKMLKFLSLFLLPIIVVTSLSACGESSSRKYSKQKLKELGERNIKEMQEAYPDRTFEVYDIYSGGDTYGPHYIWYMRCIEDGVKFDVDSTAPLEPEMYLYNMWRQQGAKSVQEDLNRLFEEKNYVYAYWGDGPVEKELMTTKTTYGDLINNYLEKNKKLYIGIECHLYCDSKMGEINKKEDAKKIYQIFDKYIPKGKNMSDYRYSFEFVYISDSKYKGGLSEYQDEIDKLHNEGKLINVIRIRQEKDEKEKIKSEEDIEKSYLY